MPGPAPALPELDAALRGRLSALCDEGWDLWDRFDVEVRQKDFHPFVAADYPVVLAALERLRAPGLRFLEWGSATGVVTILADLLGYEAYGIELDAELVRTARSLAARVGSRARFAVGSFLPLGYRYRSAQGDERLGTVGDGASGYLELGRPLDEFDVVFTYPWPGEEPMPFDLIARYGRPDALLVMYTVDGGVRVFRGGRPLPDR